MQDISLFNNKTRHQQQKSYDIQKKNVQNVRRMQRRKLQERVYREKIRTVEELQEFITEWERLDQRVIDNAVTQWRKRLRACVAADTMLYNQGYLGTTVCLKKHPRHF